MKLQLVLIFFLLIYIFKNFYDEHVLLCSKNYFNFVLRFNCLIFLKIKLIFQLEIQIKQVSYLLSRLQKMAWKNIQPWRFVALQFNNGEHLYCCQCFACIISPNLYHSLMKVPLASPFYRWGNWREERISKSSKTTKLGRGTDQDSGVPKPESSPLLNASLPVSASRQPWSLTYQSAFNSCGKI